jgi:WD40 repeat protein
MKDVLWLIPVLWVFVSAPVQGAYDDVVKERIAQKEEVKGLLTAKAWDKLEAMADELRESEARFSNGAWKLSRFYLALGVENFLSDSSPDQEWQDWLASLEGWEKAFPDSVTLATVRGRFWTDYAWKARGNGWASTVTEEGWEQFRSRLDTGAGLMDAFAAKFPGSVVPCPGFHTVWHTYALGQGWPVPKAEKLVDAVLERWPDYFPICDAHSIFLLPRWYGRPGDWQAFARRIYHLNPGGHGAELYARLVLERHDDEVDYFESQALEWTWVREGFMRLLEAYPGSGWNLNHLVQCAILANDPQCLASLVKLDENDFLNQSKGGPGWADGLRRWAKEGAPLVIKPVKRIRPDDNRSNSAEALAISPDGRWMAAGFRGGELLLATLPDGEVLSFRELAHAFLRDVKISPDGTLLAVALQRYVGDDPEYAPTSIRIYQVEDPAHPKEIARFEGFRGRIRGLRFSPDSKTLLVGGGSSDKTDHLPYQLHVWDRASGKLTERTTLGGTGVIDALTFSGDGETVCYGLSEAVWEASAKDGFASSRQVMPPEVHRGNIRGIALSGNGQWMATISDAGKNPRQPLNGKIALTDRQAGTHHLVNDVQARGGLRDLTLADPFGDPFLVAVGDDGWIRFWSGLEEGELKPSGLYPGDASTLCRVAFVSRSGTAPLLVTSAGDGTLCLYRFQAEAWPEARAGADGEGRKGGQGGK